MKAKSFLFSVVISALLGCVAISGAQEKSQESDKPSITEANLIKLTATVKAIDLESRVVTLEGAEGKQVTIDVDETVKNLPQVEVGDQVIVNYYESIAIQVRKPEGNETATAVQAVGTAQEGEKPADVTIGEVTVVTTIEAIDKENETVTLKGPKGNSRTIKVREPENLEKVAIGDQVVITYTEALAISVEEPQ